MNKIFPHPFQFPEKYFRAAILTSKGKINPFSELSDYISFFFRVDEHYYTDEEFWTHAPNEIYVKGKKHNNDIISEIKIICTIPNIFKDIIYPLWNFLEKIDKWNKDYLLLSCRGFAIIKK